MKNVYIERQGNIAGDCTDRRADPDAGGCKGIAGQGKCLDSEPLGAVMLKGRSHLLRSGAGQRGIPGRQFPSVE